MKLTKDMVQRIKTAIALPRSPSPSGPQPTPRHISSTKNLEILRPSDGQPLRQTNLASDTKQFTLDVFKEKFQFVHEKRIIKQKAQINQLLDIVERKMNDEARLKMERDRLLMYRGMIETQVRKTQPKLNLAGIRNQKDLQRLAQDIDELMAKIEKLLIQKDANEKNIDQIKNFYMMVTKNLSENVSAFREQINRLEHNGMGFLKGWAMATPMSQSPNENRAVRVRSHQQSRQNKPFIFKESLEERILSNRAFGKQRRRMVTAPGKLSQRALADSLPLSQVRSEHDSVDSQIVQMENEISFDELGSFDDHRDQFEHLLEGNAIIETKFEKKALKAAHIVNGAQQVDDDVKSITSSLGPSVYKEIMDEFKPFRTDNPSDNYNSNPQGFIYDPKGTSKFIPVKISFKIGADHLPPYLSTVDFGERIYSDLSIKSLFFHLTETNEICGLQFRFLHKENQGEFLGKLHGRLGSQHKTIDFNDGEFLNMAHFKHNSQGLFWVKLFTNRNEVDVGSNEHERPTFGIRYFPREVKLCKVFSYFNARTGNLAQMKFIYVRTVFY